MRLLANENVSATVIEELRGLGHDVLSVKESLRGARDATVLGLAQTEQRLVVTHDKDIRELAFRSGLPAECGVILLRLSGGAAESDQRRAALAIHSRTDWAGHFSVVTEDGIRMRPLPDRQPAPPSP
jgi:predicted nuclease of predicted toxin-antitoxin system